MILILTYSSVEGAINIVNTNFKPQLTQFANGNYTHTVFCGVASDQMCIPCHDWSININNAYQTGNYDFEYVSMIIFNEAGQILNYEARNWSKRYDVYGFPTTIIDGNFSRLNGDVPGQLPGALDAAGNRTVANITASIDLIWLGNATVNITISITNNDNVAYDGFIDTFITENVSRYNTVGGLPFRFGFLDFAYYNESIYLNAGETFTNYTVWNGNEHEDNQGNNFGDVTKANLQVTMTVNSKNTGYVDETTTAYFPNIPPNSPSNPNPADGETDVSINALLSWTCSDPENDPLNYDVYYGDINPPPLVVSNQSSAIYDPVNIDFYTTYYWKIIAWDNRDASNESPIWSFTTMENNPPITPAQPSGPIQGYTEQNLVYSTSTYDPDEDQIYYWFDWGDGASTGWLGPYLSNETIFQNHVWSESGIYQVMVKAKDIYDAESNWSEPLEVNISEPEIPQLKIFLVESGVFRITVFIQNVGSVEATDINWNISFLTGEIIFGRQSEGKIKSLPPGAFTTINSKFIFGRGKSNIVVGLEKEGEVIDIKTTEAYLFLFGFFIWVLS